MLGTLIKQLKSTGIYFTSPAPEASLPGLPGEHVKSVESDAPLMVGEFLSKRNERFVMVVNLSLEKSANFILQTKTANERMYLISVGEDTPSLYDFEAAKHASMKATIAWRPKTPAELNQGIWLSAGQGALLLCTGEPR